MKISVVWATTSIQDSVEVDLPAGATIGQAVERSGLLVHYALDAASLGLAVYGRRATRDTELAEGDRVELTRPLEIDPKAARSARALAQAPGKPLRRVKRRPK